MATTRSKVAKENPDFPKVETASTEVVDGLAAKADSNAKKQYKVKKNFSPNMLVPVKNGFQGRLIYKSRRTGEVYVWDTFGDEQDIELQELRNARSSSRAFFENNWFIIDDPEIIEYLGAAQYYKNALKFDSFDDLFFLPPDQMSEAIKKLPNGQKRSVIYRAKQLISEGTIDSMKTIDALEKCLSTELIEH